MPVLQMVTIELFQSLSITASTQMTNEKANNQVQFHPDNMLASLNGKLNLKNDAALSRALEVAPPIISKIRHRRLPGGASLLILMHEVTDLSIKELRSLMGDRRNKFRISDKQFKPKEAGASKLERVHVFPDVDIVLRSLASLPFRGGGAAAGGGGDP